MRGPFKSGNIFSQHREDVGQGWRNRIAFIDGKCQAVGLAGLDVGILAHDDDLSLKEVKVVSEPPNLFWPREDLKRSNFHN